MTRRTMYRNWGRTVYHIARADWLWTGKAECGANIARPTFTLGTHATMPAGRRLCRKCAGRVSA